MLACKQSYAVISIRSKIAKTAILHHMQNDMIPIDSFRLYCAHEKSIPLAAQNVTPLRYATEQILLDNICTKN
jgi:hypothetical protein